MNKLNIFCEIRRNKLNIFDLNVKVENNLIYYKVTKNKLDDTTNLIELQSF